MGRLLPLALLFLACTIGASAAAVQMEVARMSPSSGFVLPRSGTIYMEIAYRADQPIRLQARAFAKGMSLDAGQMMNASVVHPAGGGRALVWVSYSEPALIDEIRVTAYDEKWQPLTTLPVVRPAEWLAKPAERQAAKPDWVEALIQAERKIAEQYRKDNPPEPDPMGDLMVVFMFLAIPGYFVLQAAALLTQSGGWRLAGMAPLLVMAPATLHAVFALAAGSNIWPIVLIFAAPIGFLYLVAFFIVRMLRSRLSFA